MPAAYVRMDMLPLTGNGKLDRKALPSPDEGAFARPGYEPPLGETERRLAAIWADLLKLDQVGRHDNFFDLGGHSLLAVRVVSRLHRDLGAEVPLATLFTYPVLSEFARYLGTVVTEELSPLPLADRSGRLPLSLAQQRLWFLAQMEGGNQAYNIPFGLRLTGGVDRAALRRALNRIVARHEALRTTFVMLDGDPVQQITPEQDSQFLLLEQDLSQAADPERALGRLVAEEGSAPFDLERGPLVRGRLLHLGGAEWALLITMHHIVSDGWSMGIFKNELSTLYSAFHDGLPDPLHPLGIQYADYAVWQRKWLAGDRLQQQAAYWKSTLSGAPALLELPADHPRPFQQDYRGDSVGLVLDRDLTAALKQLSRRHGTTMFMTMLAAWAVLLARLSGQRDIVIGTPSANRGRTEAEGLIGFFVNTLALRLDLSGSPTVAEVLAQARAQSIAAQQQQDIPFEQVVELLQPVRSLSHAPLFQVMFAWQNNDDGTLELSGLEQKALGTRAAPVAKHDLTLSMGEAGDQLRGGLSYATSLFERVTVDRFAECFRTMLSGMVDDDARSIDRLPLLRDAERLQLLYGWNETATEFPESKCIHQLFEQQVRRIPDAAAVVFGGDSLSYGELNRRSNQLAHYLRGLGVVPDSRVAICVERSFEMIVGLLAILKAGGAYVPLDPAYPSDRLHFMLEDSGPVALLTQRQIGTLFSGSERTLPVLHLDDPDAPWTVMDSFDPDPSVLGLTPRNLAYVIYTSGSTGLPKGVLVEHRGLTNLV